MTASVQYLEAAKIEEVAAELRHKGYEVILQPQGVYEGYDLIATKGDKKLAVEVRANTQLRESAETIKALHRRAAEQGIDEFRLVVVSPPHERAVKIAGLESKLKSKLENKLQQPGQIPENVYEEWNFQRIDGVVEIDVNSVEVTLDGIRVSGSAIVKVSSWPFNYQDPKQPYQHIVYNWNLPFTFDVKLNHDLEISEVFTLEIDPSSLEEE